MRKRFPPALFLLGAASNTPCKPRPYSDHVLHRGFMKNLSYRTGVAMLLVLENQHHNPVYLTGGCFSPEEQDI